MRSIASTLVIATALALSTADLRADNCHPPPTTCDNAPAWIEGAKYKAGDRVLGVGGNLWECKKGRFAKLCDDKGRQPDVDAAASEAWTFVDQCLIFDVPEVSVSDVFVSDARCDAGSIVVSANIVNDSPWGLDVPVAFYHSATKTLIGVVTVPLVGGENGPEVVRVDMLWNNPLPGSSLVTVVADDDGTGRSTIRETNESDNALATTLVTCPVSPLK